MADPERVLYVRPRNKVVVEPRQQLYITDLLELAGPASCVEDLSSLPYARAPEGAGQAKTISFLKLISLIDERCPDVLIRPLAGHDVLVEVEEVSQAAQGRGMHNLVTIGVAVLFTLGAAMAIMNFHADVSMPIVHERIYYLLTGQHVSRPLWMQIPYSVGVGTGILIFFNQVRRRGTGHDPSPLELEMYLYDRNVDHYRLTHDDGPNG